MDEFHCIESVLLLNVARLTVLDAQRTQNFLCSTGREIVIERNEAASSPEEGVSWARDIGQQDAQSGDLHEIDTRPCPWSELELSAT